MAHRLLMILKNGPCHSLRDLVELEKQAVQFTGVKPIAQDLMWLPEFQLLESSQDMPTLIAAFFGDPSAEKLGYQKLGFPPSAGRLVASLI